MSKEYNIFKNMLHNEMGIGREEIGEMVRQSIEKIVEKKVDDIFETKRFTTLLNRAISDVITGEESGRFSPPKEGIEDFIKKTIREKVAKEVKN